MREREDHERTICQSKLLSHISHISLGHRPGEAWWLPQQLASGIVSCNMEPLYLHHDTKANQDHFLECLSQKGNILAACAASGVHRQSVYSWLYTSTDFHTRKKEALLVYTEWLESRLHDFIAEPKIARSSIIALLFSLKGHLPNKYRDAITDMPEKEDASALLKLLRSRKAADSQQPKVLDQANAILADNPPSV